MCRYCENDGYYKANKSLISKTLKNNVNIDLSINVKDKKDEMDKFFSKKVEEEMGNTLVHGAMTYECEECGKTWKMWLEVGVEGKDKIMPCPFIIRCKCGGMAKHINWQNDIWLPEPRPLGENMSYFKLDREGLKKKDINTCGIPVLR